MIELLSPAATLKGEREKERKKAINIEQVDSHVDDGGGEEDVDSVE